MKMRSQWQFPRVQTFQKINRFYQTNKICNIIFDKVRKNPQHDINHCIIVQLLLTKLIYYYVTAILKTLNQISPVEFLYEFLHPKFFFIFIIFMFCDGN